MHELSIAYSIVRTIEEKEQNFAGKKVKRVFLKIGKLSGVVKNPLLFSFDILREGTLLANAVLEIEEIPIIIYCRKCAKKSELSEIPIFRCIWCGEPCDEILQGKEMEIVSLEIEDE